METSINISRRQFISLLGSSILVPLLPGCLPCENSLTIASHAESTSDLVRAHFRGLHHVKTNRQDAVHRMAPRLGIPSQNILEAYKGTTFKILLPTTNKPPEKTAVDIPQRIWHGTGTVLLVDDEESVRGTGMAMLQELGFTTITAENGRQAIDKFNRHPGIECVILDLTMPLMDGAECFRELRQINPHIRIIVSSGYNELEVTTKFAGAGLTGFIQKPYRLSALREALQGT